MSDKQQTPAVAYERAPLRQLLSMPPTAMVHAFTVPDAHRGTPLSLAPEVSLVVMLARCRQLRDACARGIDSCHSRNIIVRNSDTIVRFPDKQQTPIVPYPRCASSASAGYAANGDGACVHSAGRSSKNTSCRSRPITVRCGSGSN